MLTTMGNRLWHFIEESLILNSQKQCVTYKDVELSYDKLHRMVNLLASFLFESKISSFCNNCMNPISFTILQLAGIQIGASSYLFLPKDAGIIVLDDKFVDSALENQVMSKSIKHLGEDEAYSFFFNSSGTTSIPHVIENTSQSFYFVCNAIKHYAPMNEYLGKYDRFLLCCPLNHSFGFSSLLEMIAYGVHVYFPDTFSILDIIKSIHSCDKKQINSILASPFIVEKSIQLLHGSFLSKLQHIGLGTDKPSIKLIESIYAYNENILVSNRYGLTECPSAIFVSNFLSKEKAIQSLYNIAPPLPIYKYKVSLNEDKEYSLSVLNLLTNKVIHTGDCVGYDKQNQLYLIGRNKDIIKYNGFRINCSVVENILLRYTEIEDCLLYVNENKLILLYVSKQGLNTPNGLIRAYWDEYISKEYYPDLYKNVCSINRTITGKKQRR